MDILKSYEGNKSIVNLDLKLNEGYLAEMKIMFASIML
jgi:hypothetical protein